MSLELNVDNLVKSFGQRKLFHVDQLRVGEGESLHLSGENGSGKTTLMKILAGLERPCSGRVMVTPKARRWWSDRIHPQVIYLHQTPYIFSGDVRDNVAYGLRLRSYSRRDVKLKVQQALAWARLEHLAEQPAYALSGGEKQRLALARAWILAPSLLLLDEPTANLDQHSVRAVSELVTQLLDKGTTVMVSSHQKNAVTDLCGRRLHLENLALQELGNAFSNELNNEPELKYYVQH
ncbi:energy-coupling factor ABC transporter ATP-binding protein [Amphritea balenae]|uniref:ABC transporter ATP-binding protein n=1 Tax=Amphritea balenae TaxID=452629 RepID=A0A3P1SQN6_9GAMM|nr:ABC transporter ATP-binding protein [Amphritea balenae]RRC99551.1 ABC transporter ATP-binding protein [Amphritea balenae]GGK77956.1 ABC transporter ATP-binding protein [Amphritea balenae]